MPAVLLALSLASVALARLARYRHRLARILALGYPSWLWRSVPDSSAGALRVTANDCIPLPHAYNPHSNRLHGGLVQRGLSAAIAAAAGFNVCAAADKRYSLNGKINGIAMTDLPRLTRKAAKFWDAMPSRARAAILANVYCVRCRGAVSIIAASGTLKRGDLVLEGKCGKCGHQVGRLVEGPNA